MDLQKAILQNIWWTHAWHARDRLEGGTGHLLFLVWGIACGAVFTLWKLMATHPCDQCAFLYVLIYSIPIKSFFKENKWHTLGAHSAGDRTSPEDVSLLKKMRNSLRLLDPAFSWMGSIFIRKDRAPPQAIITLFWITATLPQLASLPSLLSLYGSFSPHLMRSLKMEVILNYATFQSSVVIFY